MDNRELRWLKPYMRRPDNISRSRMNLILIMPTKEGKGLCSNMVIGFRFKCGRKDFIKQKKNLSWILEAMWTKELVKKKISQEPASLPTCQHKKTHMCTSAQEKSHAPMPMHEETRKHTLSRWMGDFPCKKEESVSWEESCELGSRNKI